MATTTKGVPYPLGGDAPDGAAQIQAVAEWIDAYPGTPILTSTQRDALAIKWPGMRIHNSTLGRDQRWTGAAWAEPESGPVLRGYLEEIAAGGAVSGARTYGQGANVFADLLTGNVTCTIDLPLGGTCSVWHLQDGTGGRTASWAAAGTDDLRWSDGSAPTPDVAADRINLWVFTKPFPAVVVGTLALDGVH